MGERQGEGGSERSGGNTKLSTIEEVTAERQKDERHRGVWKLTTRSKVTPLTLASFWPYRSCLSGGVKICCSTWSSRFGPQEAAALTDDSVAGVAPASSPTDYDVSENGESRLRATRT